MDPILVLKLLLTPALILCVSIAGIRWGHAVSGWLAGLPLVSAPVIFFLALEQGNSFASKSAEGTILGIVSLSIFSLTYSWLSLRLQVGWFYPMVIGWCLFFASSLLLEYATAPLVAIFVCVSAWLYMVNKLLPTSPRSSDQVPLSGSAKWDVPVRMVAATLLVFVITEAAPFLGATLSGILTAFPIYMSVMATSLYNRQGATASIQFVRGMTASLFTPAVFYLIVGTLIVSLGVGGSYTLAISVSFVVHWFLLTSIRKQI